MNGTDKTSSGPRNGCQVKVPRSQRRTNAAASDELAHIGVHLDLREAFQRERDRLDERRLRDELQPDARFPANRLDGEEDWDRKTGDFVLHRRRVSCES